MDIAVQFTEQIEAIRGCLLMVDFSEDRQGWFTCHPHPVHGSMVHCAFKQDLADVDSAQPYLGTNLFRSMMFK